MGLTVSLIASELTLPLLHEGLPGMQVQEAASVDDNSRRMIAGDFDVAEMSLATFVRAVSRGAALVGLPVFPGRRFVQVGMLARRGSGIGAPAELVGRRVAVPQYWLTSSVWHRGILQDQYGVAPESVEWLTTAPERGGADYPLGVSVTRVEHTTIPELFAQDRIDAALVPRPINEQQQAAGAVNLFDDLEAAKREYFEATGIFPIMHFVAMKRDVLQRAPDAPLELVAAFRQAQKLPGAAGELGLSAPPVGMATNRAAIERFLSYAHEQQLVRELPAWDQLFLSDPSSEHAPA